jgi:hypothetical protein
LYHADADYGKLLLAKFVDAAGAAPLEDGMVVDVVGAQQVLKSKSTKLSMVPAVPAHNATAAATDTAPLEDGMVVDVFGFQQVIQPKSIRLSKGSVHAAGAAYIVFPKIFFLDILRRRNEVQ